MNRKNFLSSLAGVGALVPGFNAISEKQAPSSIILPPYLKKGDTIGITCPAGHIDRKSVV